MFENTINQFLRYAVIGNVKEPHCLAGLSDFRAKCLQRPCLIRKITTQIDYRDLRRSGIHICRRVSFEQMHYALR